MADKFKIKVISIKQEFIQLEVTIVHSDQKIFYDTKVFGTLLLIDQIHVLEKYIGGILEIIPRNEIETFNLNFIKSKSSKVIASIEIIDIENFPISHLQNLTDEECSKFWSNEGILPKAKYIIRVRKKEYLDHLKANDSWYSGAYSY